MRLKYYSVHFPGQVYSNGPTPARNEREFRAFLRRLWGYSRLPKGTAIWQV